MRGRCHVSGFREPRPAMLAHGSVGPLAQRSIVTAAASAIPLIMMKMSRLGGWCSRNAASIWPEAASALIGRVFVPFAEHLGDDPGRAINRLAVRVRVGMIQRHAQCSSRLGAGLNPAPRRFRHPAAEPPATPGGRSSAGEFPPNTTPRCFSHQLSPDRTGEPQNMPGRSGDGSPSIHLQPPKSASLRLPSPTEVLRCGRTPACGTGVTITLSALC
jgi:hypothetical protein